MRTALLTGLIVTSSVLLLAGQRSTPAGRSAAPKDEGGVTCAADLGEGVKSKRNFCDVIIGSGGADSVLIALPARRGSATLTFDLHNRFTVPSAVPGPVLLAYARHEATVAVVAPSGDVLGRAVVTREFRTAADLFDQIGGGTRQGGVKAVAPGPPEQARIAVPAGVDSVGVVGSRLRVLTRAGGEQVFDTPGRPVAILSNVRIDSGSTR
jgi:hypothetical protein